MSYEEIKSYLDSKPRPLNIREKEYINLKLKGFSTNSLVTKFDTLTLFNNPTKTEKEEIIQIKNILIGRLK